MTQLLISVTTIQEAQLALENGADIIDLKDPSAGALGALPLQQIRAIVSHVDAKRPISATIGDLPMQPNLLLERVNLLSKTQIDFIKIGFFQTDDYQSTLDALLPAAQSGLKLIAVLFAEYQYPKTLIAAIRQAGFNGLMIDTAQKNGATYMDYYSKEQYKKFSQLVSKQGLSFGVAGSLQLKHVAVTKKVKPTYMGFRGGVCVENQRGLSLDVDKIRAIRKAL